VLYRLFPSSHIRGIFLHRQATNGMSLAQNARESIFYLMQLEGTYSVSTRNYLLRWFVGYVTMPHQLQQLCTLDLLRQGSCTSV
jgi:hypothetical protein